MTVDVSKLTGYGIVKPLAGGVGVSKLTGYAIVSPLDGGVGVSKLTGYAIVFEGLNATEIAIDVPFQSADLQLEGNPEYQFNIDVPFQSISLELSNINLEATIDVPFQSIDLQIAAGDPVINPMTIDVPFQSISLHAGEPIEIEEVTIAVPFQAIALSVGIEADTQIAIGFTIPFQGIDLNIDGGEITELIVAALLSKMGSFANFGSPVNPGPAALTSSMVCEVSEL